MRALHVVVTGCVQGVGFRAFVVHRAREQALAGWVRNRPDGSVEVEAHGSPGALEAFVEALREAPRHARVEHAAVEWFDAAEAPDGFRITG